jgi:hypothetical protein
LGPLLFLLYINDLPAIIKKKAIPVLFADDTSILFTHHNFEDFHRNSEIVLGNVNTWFKNNYLSLNTEKTHYIHFKTKNSQPNNINLHLENNRIFNTQSTKFLGLIVDNMLSWKPHINYLINKLSTACYVIRSIKPYVNTNAIIMIYHSLFHAVMTYGIIFWGNSSHSTEVFKIQKKAIRIIMGCGSRESCRNLFKELHILPLMSQYIFSLLMFVSNNREQYFANFEIHNMNTRHINDLHLPRTHLSIYQKGVYYSGIKIFNSLPRNIKKNIDNPKKFKKAVKNFLYTKSFYSLLEFYDTNNTKY